MLSDTIYAHKVAVAGFNANGESDIWFCKVWATDEESMDGSIEHAAIWAAGNDGFTGKVAFTSADRCSSGIMALNTWECECFNVDVDGQLINEEEDE
jgi:hypothetical protein